MPRSKEAVQAASTSALAQQEMVSEGLENFELPRSLVTKIARSALPENTKLQKDVVTSYVKASTVFISYLAATAHDVASSKQHKSVSASDILKALEMMEMGDMVDVLQTELQGLYSSLLLLHDPFDLAVITVYRDLQKADKHRRASNAGSTKGKGKESEAAPPAKGRGKEKAAAPAQSIPPITISRSAVQRPPQLAQDELDEDAQSDEEQDEEMLEPEDDVMEEDIEEDAESDAEDVMAVEEVELRRDASALDEDE
ncbi:hypothetical protein OBBRIDRAFT_833479 [Obba rivulosa]|uniref:DNA polymerase epsilon subunit D n=1 Tax=Obba rivulosa TaxID=1052685 RepID=A0A8E2DM66_9APHY|nr:hypothetical protein OBBRIDRAFT_833479 [Obba rivulosa]